MVFSSIAYLGTASLLCRVSIDHGSSQGPRITQLHPYPVWHIFAGVIYIYIVIVTRMTLIMGGESEDSLLGYEQIRKGAQLHPHETA